MRLVCIGDSITFGYGVLKNESWVSLLNNELKSDVINKGVNGDTTAGMLSRSYTDVVTLKPTHVIIMGGYNDFMGNRSLTMVENNLAELLKEALSYNIIPIVGIEPPIGHALAEEKWSKDVDYILVNNTQESYRDWIINFCNKCKINYIDFHKYFKKVLENINPRELYVDGLHPNSLGHKLMYQCVIDAFQAMKLLPE
ncbi:hydrolase [Clostridium sp. P21]|uniref:Hydrolase n=1 Tax=Clostridium muellerianum TaxID=2716538 RepID=A0A7Y0EIU5_9CLOT|nr:GDSL-type esterase/lipase family protein [Clostridium muellerianum]NMM64191.1 hydrolase [Clostridium muellerianum]